MKTIENDYPMIPMGDITDEARKIAVAWCEVDAESLDWIEHKHKLASDIMNYARRYHESEVLKLNKADAIKLLCYEGGEVHEYAVHCGGVIKCKWCNAIKQML